MKSLLVLVGIAFGLCSTAFATSGQFCNPQNQLVEYVCNEYVQGPGWVQVDANCYHRNTFRSCSGNGGGYYPPDRQPGRDSVCFYENAGFSGQQKCLRRGERITNLSDVSFNDSISSLRIFGYAQVTVCEHADFVGECRTYNQDVYNFSRLNFNDRISSFSVN